MDPELVLSRGYREYPDDVCNLWIAAYEEIAHNHRNLRLKARRMIKRVKKACSLLVTHATFYDTSRVDECFYGEAVERENEYLERTRSQYDSLGGDFPCGNDDDMRFARRLFSIRELAYIQMGLAEEVDPNALRNMPPTNKTFSGEAFPRKIKAANRPKGRKGFLYECMGQFAEAIECYEAMREDKPEVRIERLREQMKQD